MVKIGRTPDHLRQFNGTMCVCVVLLFALPDNIKACIVDDMDTSQEASAVATFTGSGITFHQATTTSRVGLTNSVRNTSGVNTGEQGRKRLREWIAAQTTEAPSRAPQSNCNGNVISLSNMANESCAKNPDVKHRADRVKFKSEGTYPDQRFVGEHHMVVEEGLTTADADDKLKELSKKPWAIAAGTVNVNSMQTKPQD